MLRKSFLLAALAILATAAAARADLITPGGNFVSGNDSATKLSTHLGYDVVLLYKGEYDDGVFDDDEGIFASGGPNGPQFTIVNPFNGSDRKAEISWDLTGTGYELRAVAWKGGNQYWWSGVTPHQYLVGGPHVVTTGTKAVSHISFYGVRATTSVPDGGLTLLLLGMGLTGLVAVRRFVRR